MATASLDKNIVITEPEAVTELVDALVNDKSRTINKRLTSPSETARGEEKLRRYLCEKNLRSV
jgi:hypothetical protein